MPQENSAFSRIFLHRTDILSVRLNRPVQELPEIIGISRRTLFAGRSDDREVSQKTWLRLGQAEREAGLCEKKPGDVITGMESEPYPGKGNAESTSKLKDSTHSLRPKDANPDFASRIEVLENKVKILEFALASLLPKGNDVDSPGKNR